MPAVGSAALALLEEDPELGAGLPPEELEHARRLLLVPAVTVGTGGWDIQEERHGPNLGLLVLEGVVTLSIHLGDRIAAQLLGPGDVLHSARTPEALVPVEVGHHVSERARLAVLDRRFIAATRRWPALLLALHERLRVQEHRLAVHAALAKLRRVDDRILALLWHLAERWGRVGPAGVVVPLALTHETIGRLVGAQRPTVTLALGDLARAGDIERRADGALVLSPESRKRLVPGDGRRPQLRPLTIEPTADAPVLQDPAGERPPLIDTDALHQRIAALHDEHALRASHVDPLPESTARSTETRARPAADRADPADRSEP